MISPATFARLQAMFFSKVTSCCNPATVTLKFIELTSTGRITDFTGDSVRTVGQEVVLNCFYKRNISDKDRENSGVSEDVNTMLYISPLELKNKFGFFNFPAHVRKSYSQIEVEFLGEILEIESIRDLEPQHNGEEYTCLAYQINLS